MDRFRDFGEPVVSIVRDKPDGWEYLLTVALIKECLRPPLRRWRELQAGILTHERRLIADADFLEWMQTRMQEVQDLARSFTKLYSGALQSAWGAPGEPGDADEILDVVLAVARTAEQAADWELRVKFVRTSELYSGLLDLLSGAIGPNLAKLMEAAEIMDTGLTAWQADPEKPVTLKHTIVFDLPPRFVENVEDEIALISKELGLE